MRSQAGRRVAKRIEENECSEDTPVYPMLKKIEVEDEWHRQGLLVMGNAGTVVFGDMNVSGNSISAGGDIKANNLVAGNMINSANESDATSITSR